MNRRPERHKSPWETSEETRLIEIVDQYDKTVSISRVAKEAAEQFGRTPAALQAKIYELRNRGLVDIGKVTGRSWTDEEDEILSVLYDEDEDNVEELSEELEGRSISGIRNRLWKLQREGKDDMPTKNQDTGNVEPVDSTNQEPTVDNEPAVDNEPTSEDVPGAIEALARKLKSARDTHRQAIQVHKNAMKVMSKALDDLQALEEEVMFILNWAEDTAAMREKVQAIQVDIKDGIVRNVKKGG